MKCSVRASVLPKLIPLKALAHVHVKQIVWPLGNLLAVEPVWSAMLRTPPMTRSQHASILAAQPW